MSNWVTPRDGFGPGGGAPVDGRGQGMAVASLVLAILGFLTAIFLVGLLLALIGLVLGIVVLVSKRPGRGLAIGGVVTSGLVMLVAPCMLAGILLPALGQARQSARMIKSATQVRNICQGMAVYASANGGTYPPADGWQKVLVDQGLVSAELLISPSEQDPTVTCSYTYIPPMPGVDPATRVLVFEDFKNHRKNAVVGFLDGHVEMVSWENVPGVFGNITLPGGRKYPVPALPGEK